MSWHDTFSSQLIFTDGFWVYSSNFFVIKFLFKTLICPKLPRCISIVVSSASLGPRKTFVSKNTFLCHTCYSPAWRSIADPPLGLAAELLLNNLKTLTKCWTIYNAHWYSTGRRRRRRRTSMWQRATCCDSLSNFKGEDILYSDVKFF